MLLGVLLTWWMMDTADGAENKIWVRKVRGGREKILTGSKATETKITSEIIT